MKNITRWLKFNLCICVHSKNNLFSKVEIIENSYFFIISLVIISNIVQKGQCSKNFVVKIAEFDSIYAKFS